MKRLSLIIFVALMMTFAACTEKEKVDNEVATRQEQRLTVTYTVDATSNHVTLKSIEAYRVLVGDLVGKTREGSEIGIVLDGVDFRTVATKANDTVLVSDSLELVMAWVERMNLNGYEVLVRYDETTGTYHCKAQMVLRSNNQHLWQCEKFDYAVRLMFYNDSIVYVSVDTSSFWRLYFHDDMWAKYHFEYNVIDTFFSYDTTPYNQLVFDTYWWRGMRFDIVNDSVQYGYDVVFNMEKFKIIDTIYPNTYRLLYINGFNTGEVAVDYDFDVIY